jgi:hypothetical protein
VKRKTAIVTSILLAVGVAVAPSVAAKGKRNLPYTGPITVSVEGCDLVVTVPDNSILAVDRMYPLGHYPWQSRNTYDNRYDGYAPGESIEVDVDLSEPDLESVRLVDVTDASLVIGTFAAC